MSYKNYFQDIGKGLFDDSPFGFNYKRPVIERAELIKPYLHWLDAKRLRQQVERPMQSESTLEVLTRRFEGERKIDRTKLIMDTMNFFNKEFPQELSADMFNLYNKRSEKLNYKARSSENLFRYKVLDKILDPIDRMITEGSNVKSMIMTRSMVQYFCMLMAYQKQVDPDKYEEMKQAMSSKGDGESRQKSDGKGKNKNQKDKSDPQDGQSDGSPQDSGDPQDSQDGGDSQDSNGQDGQDPQDSSNDSNANGEDSAQEQTSKQSGRGKSGKASMTPEQALEKLMKNEKMESLQEDLLNQAREAIQDLNEIMDEQEQEVMWENATDSNTGFDKATISALVDSYRKTKMSMEAAAKVIRKLLDKSKNYFNGKETPEFESLFESSSVGDIVDLELLHPKLRKFFADDIMVKNIKREGKINVYIDISGSMSSKISIDNQSVISGLDFAKSFVIKMLEMDLVDKVYAFNGEITAVKATPLSVSTLKATGGTYISGVVQHIEQERVNAIVITDAEDSCYLYSAYAYFIGILDCKFTSFDRSALKKYAEHAQIVEFDGHKIHNIDHTGKRAR